MSLRLPGNNYTCVHMSGTDNVWTDLFGCWSVPLRTIRQLVHIPPLPSGLLDDFEWPTAKQLCEAQELVPTDAQPATAHRSDETDGLSRMSDGPIRILDVNDDVKLRL